MLSNFHKYKQLECILILQIQGRIQKNMQISVIWDICNSSKEKVCAF